ncbi:MAG: protein-L-isoaspartate(D-aspartate) O-methyltransferase [Dehalococcoidales bacterium]|nr:protein-L-isoaspartate(D-aspartate) O-methyltransferase [Dehalococcoidales bacterium]
MNYQEERDILLRELGTEIDDKRVLAAMSRVPREEFVLARLRYASYEDRPLSIGHDQTISQPMIIAIMTEALELSGTDKVLEVGTGSGYQSAILAELVRHVVSVERIPTLSATAGETLARLGYTNIELHIAEETLGWQRGAPYDAIIVTAGAPQVPEELIEQLTDGGRMVIPVGQRHLQELYKCRRRGDDTTTTRLGGCRFVSLIGKNAWKS